MATVRTELSDEMLMVRYQRADREAFAELLRRHHAPIYNFVLRQLGNAELARAVTQDIFLRVVQSAREFKHEARFATWLYTIARNLVVGELRARADRGHPGTSAPDSVVHGSSVEPNAAGESASGLARVAPASQVENCVVRAVDALPHDQREVFLLRELANLPFKDIAIITGVHDTVVKSRMRYALAALQQALVDFEEYARALR